MAICDLSSKNANVFYELGLRQAFNKKTILITDGRDKAPFDISGFRYVSYTPTLRVDSVEREIISIGEMLLETETAPEDDVNSIVKLLKIQPAHVEPLELNKNESMIFSMFSKLEDKIDSILPKTSSWSVQSSRGVGLDEIAVVDHKLPERKRLIDFLESDPEGIANEKFIMDGDYLGQLVSFDKDQFTFENKHSGQIKVIPNTFSNAINILSMRKRRPLAN